MEKSVSTTGNLHPASGMRVVVMEPDSEIRRILRHSIDAEPEFHLVAECQCQTECAALLEAYVPELLITRIEPSVDLATPSGPFPLCIQLRPADLVCTHSSTFDAIDIPLDSRRLGGALARARTEIYRRKLDELAGLLHNYMDHTIRSRAGNKAMQINVGPEHVVPATDIVFIAADGNYVKLHTAACIHELRDTMAAVSARLDPSVFCRVHRSYIVNRGYVTNVLRKDGAAVALELSNGAEVPVGPSYRSEVERIALASRRLSA